MARAARATARAHRVVLGDHGRPVAPAQAAIRRPAVAQAQAAARTSSTPAATGAGAARRGQGPRQRMARRPGQPGRRRQHRPGRPRSGSQLRPARGQGAGLVEHHRVGRGEPLQRRRRLEQHAPAQQPAAGQHLHRRHGQAQRAGAGDDQHRDGVEQRRLPGARAGKRPAEEGRSARPCTAGA